MLDLTIFRNRMFAAATGAAFINGLSRFALLFVFVFYFQGAQGDDPITAGIKLTPMAIGMLIASPLAGIWADRHGSRALAALGMLVSAVGPGPDDHAPGATAPTGRAPCGCCWSESAPACSTRPNTAAMMGAVPTDRRGIAAGARTMLQNTGAVISIAFVLAIVTAAVPKPVLFKIFSGLASGLSEAKLEPFIHNMHTALWVLAVTSVLGAGVSLLRPRHAGAAAEEAGPPQASQRVLSRRPRERRRAQAGLRIGDVAELTGTTPRTIRYYEEIGLLPVGSASAEPGRTASTTRTTVERLRELLRLKELLGVSLDELKELVAAEDARAALRREWRSGVDDPVRRREILDEALGHIAKPARAGASPPRRDRQARARADRGAPPPARSPPGDRDRRGPASQPGLSVPPAGKGWFVRGSLPYVAGAGAAPTGAPASTGCSRSRSRCLRPETRRNPPA